MKRKEVITLRFEELLELEQDQLNLLEKIEQQKKELLTSIVDYIQTISPSEALEVVSDFYWRKPNLAGLTRQVYKSAFNKRLDPIPHKLPFRCSKCKCRFKKKFSTWESYKRYEKSIKPNTQNNNRYSWIKCKRCKKQEELQLESEVNWVSREEAIQYLRSLPYKEYLQSDWWKGIRLKALKAAHFRCQLCNAKGELHVHHRTYENLGCEYMSDLIVLCKKCHRKHHDIGDNE